MTPTAWHEKAKQILEREQRREPQGPTDCGETCGHCDTCVEIDSIVTWPDWVPII